MSAKFTIRASVPADAEAVFRMIVDSADSDGAREAVCVDAAALLRDRFGDAPRFQLLSRKDRRAPWSAWQCTHFPTPRGSASMASF
jgi:hypothetical protein